ncbi:MAG: hypothetical protein NTY19_05005 [Planctomycetota bacterium]|nr:hypothetical protein [Planctomycetota bacterium]
MTEFQLGEVDDIEASGEDQPILVSVARDHATTDEPSITYFDEDYLVDCGELGCMVRQADGTWEVSFDVYVTTEYPSGEVVTRRKVPSNTLREQLWHSVGIRTRLAGHPVYPSLVGRLPTRPDPNDVLESLTTLLATVDLDLLFTEPDDDGVL